jgi:hypothetical protein
MRARGRRVRVACFSPYPALGPSVRHRILAFREAWREAHIDLTFYPFMSPRLYAIRRQFSLAASIEKIALSFWAILMLIGRTLTVGRYDLVIIHREACPAGAGLFERAIQKLSRRVVFDFDDALWQPPSNPVDQRRLFRSSSGFAAVLRGSRIVVAGNEYLASYARALNPDVRIIPTSYEDLGGRAGSPIHTRRSCSRPASTRTANDGSPSCWFP